MDRSLLLLLFSGGHSGWRRTHHVRGLSNLHEFFNPFQKQQVRSANATVIDLTVW